jgi:hypothetical protein
MFSPAKGTPSTVLNAKRNFLAIKILFCKGFAKRNQYDTVSPAKLARRGDNVTTWSHVSKNTA